MEQSLAGRTLIVDIETNGLLYPWGRSGQPSPVLDKVHCMVVKDVVTAEQWQFTNSVYATGLQSIEEGITQLLNSASVLVGHNILRFDDAALRRLYPTIYKPTGRLFDTQIMSRCVWPDTKTDDFSRVRLHKGALQPKHIGSHSLEAWGIRLGVHKGSIQKDQGEDWFKHYSQEMLDYCTQDVAVTAALYKTIMGKAPSPRMTELEHSFAAVIAGQEIAGFCFNVPAAETLTAELMTQRAALLEGLANLFPPRIIKYLTPKKLIPREKSIPFNPASRDQVAYNFITKYGWKPSKVSENAKRVGKPSIDESVLAEMPYPEAREFAKYYLVEKRLGMVAEGKQAWLKLVQPDGRVHGGVVTNGTITGRCSHVSPNLAQVPRVCGACKLTPCRDFSTGKIHSPFGSECRALFTARPGWSLVGCDASGIQLRMAAHYLARFDGGEYASFVTNGDPHEKNRVAAGLPTRDKAKTFIYALFFGAGAAKIGTIIGGGAVEGNAIIASFFKALPAFDSLRASLDGTARQRGYLIGLDQRRYPLRSLHVALNVLLMGGEAVIMKQAAINVQALMREEGLEVGKDYEQVAFVHDEFQFECRPDIATRLGEIAAKAIVLAGTQFALKCPLAAEFHIGRNWAETH